jgi:hypothetical protein
MYWDRDFVVFAKSPKAGIRASQQAVFAMRYFSNSDFLRVHQVQERSDFHVKMSSNRESTRISQQLSPF